ncbi:hypothetical protein QUC31_001192 [Theobroma cacao]
MASDSLQLRIMFFPQLSYGHMIPTVDTARLFARNGVKVTIATTPLNASLFANLIQRERVSGSDIDTCIIKFPSAEAGLPQGCENVSSITSPEMSLKFFKALSLLHRPLEELLEQRRPDCLVADVTFPWATDVATKFGIPRLEWHRWVDDTKFSVTKEDIERAVTRIMVGKEAEGIRNRARALKDMARKAAEGGGSSYSDLNALL